MYIFYKTQRKDTMLENKKTRIQILFGALLSSLALLGYLSYINKELMEENNQKAIKITKSIKIPSIDFKVKFSSDFPKDLSDSVDAKTAIFLLDIKKLPYNTVRYVNLTYSIGEKNNFASNGSKEKCDINIQLNPEWIKVSENGQDLKFAILHELGHCQFGKEKLAEPIVWDKSFSLEDVEKAEKLFKKQEDMFLSQVCLECENKYSKVTISSPAVVYHELMAEGLASMWWLQSNYSESILEDFYEKRFMEFLNNPTMNSHPTHFIIQAVLALHKEKKLSPQNVLIAAQSSLMAYLQEIQFHYDEQKKVETYE